MHHVKLNRDSYIDMLEAEAEGLQEIAATGTIRTPRPLCWGPVDDSAYLVMEHITLGGDYRARAQQLIDALLSEVR